MAAAALRSHVRGHCAEASMASVCVRLDAGRLEKGHRQYTVSGRASVRVLKMEIRTTKGGFLYEKRTNVAKIHTTKTCQYLIHFIELPIDVKRRYKTLS